MVQKMRQILDDALKTLGPENVNIDKNFDKPLEGFPLKTLEDLDKMESDDKASQHKKLVNTFLNSLHYNTTYCEYNITLKCVHYSTF